MNYSSEVLILKKLIQKALVNELYCYGLIDFSIANKMIDKFTDDIKKLENTQNKGNLIIQIPI